MTPRKVTWTHHLYTQYGAPHFCTSMLRYRSCIAVYLGKNSVIDERIQGWAFPRKVSRIWGMLRITVSVLSPGSSFNDDCHSMHVSECGEHALHHLLHWKRG